MATHSSVLAWRIPGTAEPGGLPSMGSHRVRYSWSDLAAADQFISNILYLSGHTDRQLIFFYNLPWALNFRRHAWGGGIMPESPSQISKLPAHGESWRSSTCTLQSDETFHPQDSSPTAFLQAYGLNLNLPYCSQILYPLNHQGSPIFIPSLNKYYSIQPTKSLSFTLNSRLLSLGKCQA